MLASMCFAAATEGKITGVVLDEQGRPVEGAQVCVSDYVGVANATRSSCRTNTDKKGQFQVQHVELGQHGVSASKPDEGYNGLTSGPSTQIVNLTADAPAAKVTLNLGPKDGILAPTAVDKVTGKPISTFRVRWTIQDENSSQTATASLSPSNKRISVPAEKEICPSFSAKGYKTLLPRDPSDPEKPFCVRLRSGEVKSLSVELVPETESKAD
jgi:5-hydroxyisourate hydrolase-like protein (transthyretin family)